MHERYRSTHFAPFRHGWFVWCVLKKEKKDLNVTRYRRKYSGIYWIKLYQYSLIQR